MKHDPPPHAPPPPSRRPLDAQAGAAPTDGPPARGPLLMVVGGGAVSERWHLPAALDRLGAARVALAEPDPERRAQLAGRLGLSRVVDDFRALLPEAFAAVVLTPPHLHAPIAIACLEAGVPVLCEKPLANYTRDCRAMLEAARRQALPLAAGHNFRLFPNRRVARERLLAGALGAPVSIEIEEGHPGGWPSWTGYTFRKAWVPGGVLLNNGLHSLDFMLWCLGEPEHVAYVDDALGGVESNARVELAFAQGVRATLHVSRTCRLANRIRIRGEKGVLELPSGEMQGLVQDGRAIPLAQPDGTPAPSDLRGTIRAQLDDFLDVVQLGGVPACDGAEAARVVEVIERCYAQKRKRPLPATAPVPGWMF